MDFLCDYLNNKRNISIHGIQDLHEEIEKSFIPEHVAILENFKSN